MLNIMESSVVLSGWVILPKAKRFTKLNLLLKSKILYGVIWSNFYVNISASSNAPFLQIINSVLFAIF